MRRRAALILFVLSAFLVGGLIRFGCRGPAEGGDLSGLAWLAGAWKGEKNGVVLEEVWLAPAGNLMLGMHRDRYPSGGVFFEFLRIVATADGIVYVANPAGAGETPFRLFESGEKRVLFANPDHDFPRTIEYRLDGRDLRVRIEGEENGKARSEEWRWRRASLRGGS